MINLFEKINKKINSTMWSFLFTGVVLLILAILVMWGVFVLKLIVSFCILFLSFTFFLAALKLRAIKKEIEKHFNIK